MAIRDIFFTPKKPIVEAPKLEEVYKIDYAALWEEPEEQGGIMPLVLSGASAVGVLILIVLKLFGH